MKSSTYYFHVKTKILADFQILLRVPVDEWINRQVFNGMTTWNSMRNRIRNPLPNICNKHSTLRKLSHFDIKSLSYFVTTMAPFSKRLNKSNNHILSFHHKDLKFVEVVGPSCVMRAYYAK